MATVHASCHLVDAFYARPRVCPYRPTENRMSSPSGRQSTQVTLGRSRHEGAGATLEQTTISRPQYDLWVMTPERLHRNKMRRIVFSLSLSLHLLSKFTPTIGWDLCGYPMCRYRTLPAMDKMASGIIAKTGRRARKSERTNVFSDSG